MHVNVVGRNGNRYVHFKTEKHFSNIVVIPSRPLHLAAQLTDIVDVLLERGADINTVNSSGTTALCITCQANNIVDMRDSVGKCAFDYIRDYEEWIQSGHFTGDIVTKLRGIVYTCIVRE